MKLFRKFFSTVLIFLLLIGNCFFIFSQNAKATLEVQGVELFRDGNLCINMASSGTVGLDITTLQTNSESVKSNISSGGSLCPVPPFFTGGAALATASGITIQAQPNVQSLGRGILISEIAGSDGGVSSSGDPTGFNSLITTLGGVSTTIFEIGLPSECDVIDDDDDVVGASADLTTINDFSFPTCVSTTGVTVQCNAASGLLTAVNALVPATSSSPAKIRFVISAINSLPDSNMIDSILIKFDSQDIFCKSTVTGPLTATVTAQNAVTSPTNSVTLGTANLGTAQQAAKISYATETATSIKGETSTNEIGTTPILLGGSTTFANKVQIEELNNESIPLGGQSSPLVINPPASSTLANDSINLWLVPTLTTLFTSPPSTSDILISDSSIVLNSTPILVMTNSDDLNAPFGSIVIPLRKNPNGADPSTVKTTITVNNTSLSATGAMSGDTYTVSLGFFEPTSGAVINTPVGISVNNSTNPTNPQNFSAFSPGSTRALAQNAVVNGAVNEGTLAAQITTNADLNAVTARDITLGAPQITTFTKVISSLTIPDVSKITTTSNDTTLTVSGSEGASVGGARVKVELFLGNETSAFDSVSVTSKSDGSFTAKLKINSPTGNASLKIKQTVSGSDSSQASKSISLSPTESGCIESLCGSCNDSCTPTISTVLDYIQNNGGLASVVAKGGLELSELIKATKKALGLN